MSYLETAKGKWLGQGDVRYYTGSLRFNELWHHVMKHYTQGLLYSETPSSLRQNPTERRWLLRNGTWAALITALQRSLLFHPFRVGHLHFHLLPRGAPGGFRSTLHAMSVLASLNPLYLYTGLLEELLSQLIITLVDRELILPNLSWLKSYSTLLHDLAYTILNSVVLAPMSILSAMARSNTPLLRSLPIKQYPTNFFERIKAIWSNDGITGFYRGWPFLLLQRISVLSLVHTSERLQSSININRRQSGILYASIVGLSIANDFDVSFPKSFPWENTALQNFER